MAKNDALIFSSIDEFKSDLLTKSAKRRLEIIEAVISFLAKNGLENLTHDKIALECGVSRTLVRHYFPSREDLVRASLRFIRARFQDLCLREMRKTDSTLDQFRAYVVTASSWVRHLPNDCRAWLLFYYYCGTDRKFQTLNTELVEQGHQRIIAILEKLADEEKRSIKNTSLKAKLIQNAITGCFISTATEQHDSDFVDEVVQGTLQECLRISESIFGNKQRSPKR